MGDVKDRFFKLKGSQKVEIRPFDPNSTVREGSAGKIFSTMLLHLMILFNLI